MNAPRRWMYMATLLATALGLGCVSEPTPHPGQADGTAGFETTEPGHDGAVAAPDGRAVCDEAGGSWRDDGSCELDLASEFDAEADAGQPPDDDTLARADVTDVAVSGEPGAYTFEVTIASDDVDCDAHADWWEVVDRDGALIHRELLTSPRPTEQPFTSAGGPIDVAADAIVIVRAHFHPEGYAGMVMIGSPDAGFVPARLPRTFATGLSNEPPPRTCAE